MGLRDHCAVNSSGERIGPGTLSTVILLVCASVLILRSVSSVQTAVSSQRGVPLAVLCLSVECGFLYAYYAFYRNCRPWSGWALYAFGSTTVIALLAVVGVLTGSVAVGPAPAAAPPPPETRPTA